MAPVMVTPGPVGGTPGPIVETPGLASLRTFGCWGCVDRPVMIQSLKKLIKNAATAEERCYKAP
jgi:hypothetical protein